MKHPSSRDLYEYWSRQRAERAAPERGDIDPVKIRHSLGDIFILASDFVDDLRFRLAGTRLCALFGREIKGESFAATWARAEREQVQAMLADVTGDSAGLVAGVTGRNAHRDAAELELLLLPLAHRGHARIRAIGVLAAIAPPYWIGERHVAQLSLGTIRHINAETEAAAGTFTSAARAVRLRRGFTVYQGGRASPPNEKAG